MQHFIFSIILLYHNFALFFPKSNQTVMLFHQFIEYNKFNFILCLL